MRSDLRLHTGRTPNVTRRSLLSGVLVAATAAAIVIVLLAGSGDDRSRDDARVRPAAVTVRTAVKVAGSPVAIAVGAGSVWVINATPGTLAAIDPRTRRLKGRPVAVRGGPFAVAVGEGAVWVACGDGTIQAFDARTRRPAGRAAHVRG
ncbi:MAG: PQQ-binding-like beta-propeller repeat protein, partial [Solirubrobacterales bacterium]|nr:PQQ-binding-like beta-propeller repeat protein [Solirubrobacterales bacterium]